MRCVSRSVCIVHQHQVIPSFIKVSTGIENNRSLSVKLTAKKTWLNTELKFIYKKLSEVELDAYASYELHLRITKDLHVCERDAWCLFEHKLRNDIDKLVNKKRIRQKKKLYGLISNSKRSEKQKPQTIPDFVINQSDASFSESELELLSKGLKYSPTPKKIPLVPIVIDIETAIQPKMNSAKDEIRRTVANVIDNAILIANKNKKKNEFQIVENLKKKDCVYMKADKGNKLVVMNKNHYDQNMLKLIEECQYKKVKSNPLPKMIRECDELRKSISKTFGVYWKRTLKVPNPMVAKLYGLPKIHKPGNKMRPIVSNISTPCYKIAKWLVSEVKKLPPIPSLSVKNTYNPKMVANH